MLKYLIGFALAGIALSADATKPAAAPKIDTARYWRLQSRLNAIRLEMRDADDALQAEIRALAAKCGANATLGYQQDQRADNAGDLICIPVPPPAGPAPKK